VSATMLYLLAASRLGIDARPMLLPSHARAVVVTDGERWTVETTSPFGFDPPKELLAKARDRSRPNTEKTLDLYADEKGTEVDFAALLAVTYGNIAIAAQESGETALASSLLARESALTPPSLRAAVRMQQASMLTQRAIKKSEDGQYEEALTLARHAFALADKDEDKLRLEQNLAVFADRRLRATEAKMDDAELSRFASSLREFPNAQGDVEAEVLTILARRKQQRGDVNGSAADLRGATVSASSKELRALADRNAFSGELVRLGVLSESDPEGAWSGFGQLTPPSDARLAARYEKVRSIIATNRAIQLSNAGSCESLEQLLGETPEIPHGAALRGACRSRFGLMLARKGEFEAAARELRNARTYEPNEKRHVRNLVTVLERYEDALVRDSQCDAARNVAAEGTMIAPEEPYFGKIAQSCVSRPTTRKIVLRLQ
jgi:tetratricopeptide (TPR) repeat protein